MKKEIYNSVCSQVYATLKEDEGLTIYMEGENSQYFRFNDSKIRQTGIIAVSYTHLTLPTIYSV